MHASENNADLVSMKPGTSAPAGQPGDWRQSKWLAPAELLVVALIFVADAHHLIYFSKTPRHGEPLLGWEPCALNLSSVSLMLKPAASGISACWAAEELTAAGNMSNW